MAKIILSKGDSVLREIVLTKPRVTIGRRASNDIVIQDPAISGEHAAIVMLNGDWFLEDLNSTNGTQVSGQPISKHFLQDEDVIELAQFRIRYTIDNDSAPATSGFAVSELRDSAGLPAMIRVLNGPSSGREIALTKMLTTLGRPGVQVAAVTRSDKGFFLSHVEGDPPALNGDLIGAGPHALFDGDVIELAGTQMRVTIV